MSGVPVLSRPLRARLTVLAVAFAVMVGSAVAVVPAEVANAAATTPTPTPVFRFYKTTDGSHFFTNSASEKAQLEAIPNSGYRYEGVAFYSYPSQADGTSPVYRFYNFRQGVHFYTANAAEADNVKATASSTFRYEGIAYYAYLGQTTDTQPVYRFYKFRQGVHFYTANSNEADQLRANAANVYRYEGISYYLPTKLVFSGTGDQAVGPFTLPAGMTHFQTDYAGTAGISVELNDADSGDATDLITDEPGSTVVTYNTSTDEGRYVLHVAATGSWTILISFPRITSGVVTEWSGGGQVGTDLFTFIPLPKTLSWTFEGSDELEIDLLDQNGEIIDVLVDETGPTDGSLSLQLPYSNYSLQVYGHGNWTVSLD